MLDQITPLVLTYNEAPNIARALGGLSWAREIVVVDSFSDDETVQIANTFPNVRVVRRAFDCHRNQWEFGLKETGISTPWVLALDADYVVTDDMIAELKTLEPDIATSGYRAKFVYCINGKRLRSGIYPPVTVLYRREAATYIQDGHTQRVAVDGAIDELHAPMLHDDRKSFKRWFNSQARYTELEAQKLLAADPARLGRNCIQPQQHFLLATMADRDPARHIGLLPGRSRWHSRWLGRLLLCLSACDGRVHVEPQITRIEDTDLDVYPGD